MTEVNAMCAMPAGFLANTPLKPVTEIDWLGSRKRP
jgi:hypothetical protein